jgi:hypothetical protein
MNKIWILGILAILCMTFVSADVCFQNFPNVSTGCGGLSGGSVSYNDYFLGLSSERRNDYDINYVTPVNIAGADWSLKMSWFEGNITVPSQCLQNPVTSIRLDLSSYTGTGGSSTDVYVCCYNGTGSSTAGDCFAPDWTVLLSSNNGIDPTRVSLCTGIGDYSLAFDGNWSSYVQTAHGWGFFTDCPVAGNGFYEQGMYWNISCTSSWVDVSGACNSGNNVTRLYVDANHCGTGSPPVDNGSVFVCPAQGFVGGSVGTPVVVEQVPASSVPAPVPTPNIFEQFWNWLKGLFGG